MAPSRDIAGIGPDRAFRVRAESLDDLEILSAMLQDAIVPISEISWQRSDQRFVLMAQRFRWENGPRGGQIDQGPDALGDAKTRDEEARDEEAGEPAPSDWFERVTCALRFENVTAVRANGIDLANRGQMLELLSLHVNDGGLDLAFAGGKTIRIMISSLSCHAEDIGEPWPTTLRPTHPEDEE
jgi:hypothetical protein